MIEDLRSASRTDVGSSFPRYAAAVQGFSNYWYPVLLARDLGRRPRAVTLCGERIVLVRDQGGVYALHNRCPHRGVPLSTGRRECPGTISCIYHGWTYDLATGRLEAALTDGPESPISGKVSVRTYPATERAGLIWVYVGDQPPPPVETDIPSDLLRPDTVVEGVLSRQRGNWRYAAENGIDEGHVRYLHRWTPWTMLREIPAWTRMHMGPSDDGKWLTRVVDEVTWSDTYPRVGRWPRVRPWQSRARGALEIGIRLPCWLRVSQRGWTSYEIYVPSDTNHYLSGLLATTQARGLEAARFRAKYRLWFRWIFHGMFHDWDQWIIEQMEIPPERLYRPDASITGWRRLCEEQARGAPIPAPPTGTLALAANGATREAHPTDVPV
jgi:nitrite reductase/ring-hydroxylating ferredoxin subunit